MVVLEMPEEAWQLLASLESQIGDGMNWTLRKSDGEMRLSIVWNSKHRTDVPQSSHVDCTNDESVTISRKKKKKSPSQRRRDQQRLEAWKSRRYVCSRRPTSTPKLKQTEACVDEEDSGVSSFRSNTSSRSSSMLGCQDLNPDIHIVKPNQKTNQDQKHMQVAYDRAMISTKQEADKRKQRHDKKAKEHHLDLGTKVLLRNRVKGRNKIQDTWDPTTYKVVGRIDGGSAYVVQKAKDSQSKPRSINRCDLLQCSFSDSDSESDSISEHSSGDKSSSNTDSEPEYSFQINSQDNPKPTGTKAQKPAARQSSRSTKGQHSNPNNLPRSVLERAQFADDVPFRELTDTIRQLGQGQVQLGEMLVKGQMHLGEVLQVAYLNKLQH